MNIGIIGGSDGPTAIFLTSKFNLWSIAVIVSLIVAVGIWIIRKKKKN